MLTVLTRLVTHAYAGADARSSASVSDVWAVLADPSRWPEFEPFLESVALTGAEGEQADADPPVTLTEGQQLIGRLRLVAAEVPLVVEHVVHRSSIAVTARLFPGLAEEVEHRVLPTATGGTQLTVRIRLSGPLALPALLPRWAARVITIRLLARAAEGQLRAASEVTSVA